MRYVLSKCRDLRRRPRKHDLCAAEASKYDAFNWHNSVIVRSCYREGLKDETRAVEGFEKKSEVHPPLLSL